MIRLDDHGVVPIPPEHGNYDVESSAPMREDLRPIEITQPKGTSFTVEGSQVSWQKWQFHVSLHPIHGPVLHDVRYEDQGRLRPILHRAALSDMVVPYGDPSPMHGWKPRLRRQRAGHRPVHEFPQTGLRLPGRDPLPRRDAAELGRRTQNHRERHLHARRGLRGPLEALRPPPQPNRGSSLAPDGGQ